MNLWPPDSDQNLKLLTLLYSFRYTSSTLPPWGRIHLRRWVLHPEEQIMRPQSGLPWPHRWTELFTATTSSSHRMQSLRIYLRRPFLYRWPPQVWRSTWLPWWIWRTGLWYVLSWIKLTKRSVSRDMSRSANLQSILFYMLSFLNSKQRTKFSFIIFLQKY